MTWQILAVTGEVDLVSVDISSHYKRHMIKKDSRIYTCLIISKKYNTCLSFIALLHAELSQVDTILLYRRQRLTSNIVRLNSQNPGHWSFVITEQYHFKWVYVSKQATLYELFICACLAKFIQNLHLLYRAGTILRKLDQLKLVGRQQLLQDEQDTKKFVCSTTTPKGSVTLC